MAPTPNINVDLFEINEEFIKLKNSFNKIDCLFAFQNLSDFVIRIALLLIDVTLIRNGRVVSGISELCFNLFTVVALCWIHGLPHKACRDLIRTFDTIISEMSPSKVIHQANILLTRDTIGFRLLGRNYELTILASVGIKI